jgi:murein DD-endopeptidase MepM/ murein hydrolase activator NlpD
MPAPQAYTPPQPYDASGLPTPLGQIASSDPQQLGTPPTTLNEQAARIDGGAGAVTHVVQSGDTAWNISQRYGVSVDRLIAANGGSTTVRIGQRIVIPGASASPANVQLASVDPQSIPAPAPAAPVTTAPAAAAAPPAAPAPQEQQVAMAPATMTPDTTAPAPQQNMAAASGFRWPVRGRVISEFGKKPNGERNDGINLAVPEGTSVKAAEDGTVIYAGNELKSYGNLVLIRHADGWVSAYAHNSALQVKRGDEVRRGQVIALSGMTGGVTTPQLHFELRKDATPVNPLQHLTES